jgi:hypothetical protein
VSVRDARATAIRRARRLTLALRLDEPGTAQVTATLARGRTTVGRWRRTLAVAGTGRVLERLALTRRQRSRLRGTRLTVSVRARDRAGNTATRTVTVRVAGR